MTDLAAACALLSPCIWAIWAALQTTTDRLHLALVQGWGPDSWAADLARASPWQHLARRATCRDWRDLYPADLVAVADHLLQGDAHLARTRAERLAQIETARLRARNDRIAATARIVKETP